MTDDTELTETDESNSTDNTEVERLEVPTTGKFVVYTDDSDGWRWRLIANNGEVIADSGQGYASKQNAVDALDRVRTAAPAAPVSNIEPETDSADGGKAIVSEDSEA